MGTVRIPLPGGSEALIDKADEALVSGFVWRLMANGYVAATRGKMMIYMHRLIAGPSEDELVDHHNRNPLDNRAVNLRICGKGQNAANRGADRRRAGTTSRHKGVSWRKDRGYWAAYIHVDGKTRYLGGFETEDAAARAYNAAAILAWGEFARLNDVEGVAVASEPKQ